MVCDVSEVQPSSSRLWARSSSLTDGMVDNTNTVSVSVGRVFGSAQVERRAAAPLLCGSFSGLDAGGSPH